MRPASTVRLPVHITLRRAGLLALVFGSLLAASPFAAAPALTPLHQQAPAATRIGGAGDVPRLARAALASARAFPNIGRLDPRIFELALSAANCAVRAGDIDRLDTLTVIDYSLPSAAKRLWVFDLAARALRFEELVAHGSGSGGNVATAFSNQPESHQSSLGLFRTEDTYVGRNGYSLRLRGLEGGFNDRAYERAIVMHGAPYVSENVARAQGRIGRSWGCPVLRPAIARDVIDVVKGRGLVFAYYPDTRWLQGSKYLGSCGSVS